MKREYWLAVIGAAAAAIVISFTVGSQIMQGIQPTLWSFALVHFGGYLFFLVMPVEALIPFMITAGVNPLSVVIISLVTALPALLIDYAIGHLVPDHKIEDVMGTHRSGKYHRYLNNYGKYVILFFAATPLSSPLLTLAAGMARFPLRQLLAYTAAGLAFKYAVIAIVSSLL